MDRIKVNAIINIFLGVMLLCWMIFAVDNEMWEFIDTGVGTAAVMYGVYLLIDNVSS